MASLSLSRRSASRTGGTKVRLRKYCILTTRSVPMINEYYLHVYFIFDQFYSKMTIIIHFWASDLASNLTSALVADLSDL